MKRLHKKSSKNRGQELFFILLLLHKEIQDQFLKNGEVKYME